MATPWQKRNNNVEKSFETPLNDKTNLFGMSFITSYLNFIIPAIAVVVGLLFLAYRTNHQPISNYVCFYFHYYCRPILFKGRLFRTILFLI